MYQTLGSSVLGSKLAVGVAIRQEIPHLHVLLQEINQCLFSEIPHHLLLIPHLEAGVLSENSFVL